MFCFFLLCLVFPRCRQVTVSDLQPARARPGFGDDHDRGLTSLLSLCKVWDRERKKPNMEFFNDIGSDPSRPSIFELVAQEQLRDLLQPALKYVLSVRLAFFQTFSSQLTFMHIFQVFAQRYPRYLLRIVNRHEEFYALLMLFVERHYLRVHGLSTWFSSAKLTMTSFGRCFVCGELLWA